MARRGLRLTAVGALAVLLTAGCAPPGTDGDLVDDWPAMAQPQVWSPVEGDCHGPSGYVIRDDLGGYKPVSCTDAHQWETFRVAAFTGEQAERKSPPPVGGVDRRATFDECSAEADKFVGGSWRDGRLGLRVLYPTAQAWSHGARWFRCELAQVDTIYPVDRKESLRDALTGAAPLARGCYRTDVEFDKVPVACDKAHQYEYVGTWLAPNGDWAEFAAREKMIHKRCLSLVAKFAGLRDDSTMPYRSGTSYALPDRSQWEEGDRGVVCHLWLDRKLTRSLKGAGAKGLPMN